MENNFELTPEEVREIKPFLEGLVENYKYGETFWKDEGNDYTVQLIQDSLNILDPLLTRMEQYQNENRTDD